MNPYTVPVPEEPQDWRHRALCRGWPTRLWFPTNTRAAEWAMEFCSRCPVVGECHASATANAERCGIWGGVEFGPSRETASQRKTRRRRKTEGDNR